MKTADAASAASANGPATFARGAIVVTMVWSIGCGCGAAGPSAPASSPAAVIDRDAAEKAIARELDDFHDAAAHADEERYFAHLSPDSVFLGTDGTERWNLAAFRAFAHPYFAKGKAWSFRATRRSVTLATGAPFAYFDEDLATEKLGPARGSGVLALEGGRWKIAQYNLTTVIPNDRFAEVRALLDHPAPARSLPPAPSTAKIQ